MLNRPKQIAAGNVVKNKAESLSKRLEQLKNRSNQLPCECCCSDVLIIIMYIVVIKVEECLNFFGLGPLGLEDK